MKKSENGIAHLGIILVILVMAVIGFAGWRIYDQNKKPGSIDEILSSLNSDTRKNFSNVQFKPNNDWTAERSATAFNEAEGYDYSVSGAGKSVEYIHGDLDQTMEPRTDKKFFFFKTVVQPVQELEAVKIFAKTKLIKYGFTTTDQEIFKRNDKTCTVLNDRLAFYPNIAHEADETTNVLQINCFDDETLKTYAQQMKPFVDQYLKNFSELKASDLTVGPLTIKSQNGSGVIGPSKAAGYDIAEMVVSTKQVKQIALYYSSQNEWRFVVQANDEFGFDCDPMKKDPDARKAFYDQVCYDSFNTRQIRLDTDNRALQ